MERVSFYVDGFNLFYGLRRLKKVDADWQKCYWIDFVKLFQQFTGTNQSLEKVYYFTAPPLDTEKNNRQRLLFSANSLINGEKFEVVDGKFFQKTVKCKLCNKANKTYEEKHTDVNIAIKMIDDCLQGNVDTIALVSADGDLLTPLRLINKRFPTVKIRVYFPPANKSDALKNYMKSLKKQVVQLGKNKARFLYSIMPDVVTKNDVSYSIPPKWKQS
jgi:uncharacterized LabA/DUF88 family protein